MKGPTLRTGKMTSDQSYCSDSSRIGDGAGAGSMRQDTGTTVGDLEPETQVDGDGGRRS